MKPIIETQNNKFQIRIPISSSIEDLKDWKSLVDKALLIFLNRKINLITIQPQKYSIGYEIINHDKSFYKKKAYLINRDILLTKDVLQLISESEDFERGLLLIVLTGNPLAVIENINQLDQSDEELIVLDDDGKSFNWYNPANIPEAEKNFDNLLSTL